MKVIIQVRDVINAKKINKDITYKDNEWKCIYYGNKIDNRDYNAALNIRELGYNKFIQ